MTKFGFIVAFLMLALCFAASAQQSAFHRAQRAYHLAFKKQPNLKTDRSIGFRYGATRKAKLFKVDGSGFQGSGVFICLKTRNGASQVVKQVRYSRGQKASVISISPSQAPNMNGRRDEELFFYAKSSNGIVYYLGNARN